MCKILGLRMTRKRCGLGCQRGRREKSLVRRLARLLRRRLGRPNQQDGRVRRRKNRGRKMEEGRDDPRGYQSKVSPRTGIKGRRKRQARRRGVWLKAKERRTLAKRPLLRKSREKARPKPRIGKAKLMKRGKRNELRGSRTSRSWSRTSWKQRIFILFDSTRFLYAHSLCTIIPYVYVESM